MKARIIAKYLKMFLRKRCLEAGPREEIISRIEISTTTVMVLAQDVIDALRASRAEARSA